MKKMLARLEAARAAGTLRDVDTHLARHLLALDPQPQPELALAIAALSRANADGDVCLDLAGIAGGHLLADDERNLPGIAAPALDDWLAALRRSPLVATPERVAQQPAPLVLDAGNRLYLQKYFAFERAIVADIESRLARPRDVDDTALQQALDRGFPGRAPDDRQREAAATAARHSFAVITGGPGTGKTTTVTRLLAVLLMLAGEQSPRIALAAPTGKAAARLGESIRAALDALRAAGIDDALLARIPVEAATIHRLLGWQPGGFRHHAGNPLPVDVLVVDEASMIDLPLMSRLVAAVPASAQLVLLGDRDQLASVEAGSMLGDLCNRGNVGDSERPMARCIAVLTKSHRFSADSGIGAVARAANAGDASAAFAALASHADIAQQEVASTTIAAAVDTEVERHLAAYRHQHEPAAAIRAFNRFRFLCALRDGPFGVDNINRLVEFSLAQRGLIDARQRHYDGRPLLVTRNDYGVQLFNGDTGLVLRDGDDVLRAFFLQGDGSLRRIALNRLPAHETCYAMTVHKSQGSEFDRVALVLPDSDSPVLGRELVYTGITRAKSSVAIWSPREVLAMAIGRRVERSSGLRDALWGAPGSLSPAS